MDVGRFLARAFPDHSLGEKLREDSEAILFRGNRKGDGQAVLFVISRSEHPSAEWIARLEREYALRNDLEYPWAARPSALLRLEGRMALLLEDPGGKPLDAFPERKFPLAESLRIAVGVAGCLSRLHAKGLLHKDIKPAHILADPATGIVALTGFGIATYSDSARERQGSGPSEKVAGTFAYMAPEQTGRMNRSIDGRADLYALGVVLYEALTGTLPFTARDPLELVHSHLARSPVAPSQLDASIPALLSDLISKLLAKMPEERYQTARGVEADLRRCLAAWEALGRLDPFPLAELDVPDRLRSPEKLYGREREVAQLLMAWEQVAEGKGPQLALVSGYAGVGKSALVNELRHAVHAAGGNFAAGKFDQYLRGSPYATLAEALGGLIRVLLAKPDEELACWRSDILKAVGLNGEVVADILPGLEYLLGPQPAVPELSPRDAQNRFVTVFTRFLDALATREHPLSLFLDDLQWLDQETLGLLQPLLTHPGMRYLLLVGAYRDNEVPDTHPLAFAVDSVRKAGAAVRDIVLSPLAPQDVEAMVAEVLRGPKQRVEPLTRLVHGKTGGNPFFALQFLASLHEDGLLAFDAREGGWTWDLEGIRAKGYSDNVLDLMARKLMRLPPQTQKALKALAMVGARAEPELLARALEADGATVRTHLRDAEQAGLIEFSGNGFAFLHDRIREAAYALIPQAARAGEHLRFGRLLLGDRRVEEVEEDLFDLVNHFTQAITLLQDSGEWERVRRLCFRAGKKAKSSSAFQVARDLFAEANRLLPEGRWSAPYGEVFPLLLELAECEYLVGNLERGTELFQELLANARSDVDMAAAYLLRLKLYTSPPGTIMEVMRIGLEGLGKLGLDCPEGDEAIEAAIRADEAAVAALLGSRGFPDPAGIPEISDPRVVAVLDLVSEVMVRSSQSTRHMRWLNLQGLKICLGQGHAPASALIYTYYAVQLLPVPGRVREALAFSDLALALLDRYDDHRFRPAVLAIHAGLVHSWGRPFAAAKPLLDQALAAAQRIWDRSNGPGSGAVAMWLGFETGDPLAELQVGAVKYLDYAGQFSKLFPFLVRQYVQLLACLEGRTAGLLSFDDTGFKEEEALAMYRRVGYLSGIWQFWALKSIAAVFFGQHEEALRCVLAQREFPTPFFSTLQAAAAFFHALAATALYPEATPARQAELAAALEELLPRMKRWAEDCPENFLHRYQLVLAEKARIEGRDLEAMRLYEQATASARENGLIHMESLACERAARFYLERGLLKNADAHLRDARAGYLRWGAAAKVAQLDREFPGIEKPASPGPTATLGASVAQLDLPHVLKASQVVSGEIDLEKLIETLLRLVLEQAGADRGLLLLPEGEDFRVEAEAGVGPEGTFVHLPRTDLLPGQLAEAVFRYVVRTYERVVLDEAPASGLFAEDPYLKRKKTRSLLCLPLLKQSRLVGVLYLENRLAVGAFTPGRIAALEVLASQAAISLENARLYAALDEERTRLQTVIQQVPAGLIIAEAPSGRFLVANDMAHQVMRQSLRLSGSVAEYTQFLGFHTDGRRYRPEQWPLARALQTGETVTAEEIEMQWEDGSQGWLSVSAAPIRDVQNRVTAAVIVFQDITERKRREEALQASEERFSKAFKGNPTPMVVLHSQDWTFVDANGRFLRLLGYTAAEIQGHYAIELGTWFMALLAEAGKRLAAGGPFRDEEITAVAKSGEPKALLASLETMVLGRDTCYLATFVDVTERKLIEEQLRQSQKMEAIGSLAGGIAHDFNNLLTAINGYSELAMMGMDAGSRDFKLLRAIRNSGERAAGLTRQLLAFSRKEIMLAQVQSLNAIVSEIEDMLRRLIEENVEIRTRLDREAGSVMVDKGQVVQILMNLVVNARDAMPEGGQIIVETRRVHLEKPMPNAFLEAPPGTYVALSVTDTGTGMTPEVKAKIFEPFFTTKAVGRGTGLGLSVVYGVVKQLGGGIDLQTEPGQGTTFRIYFPQAQEEAREAASESAEREYSETFRGSETILVVEDEHAVRKFMKLALTTQGYQVLESRNGLEALRLVSQAGQRIDLVMTDLIMPDLGGRELAERVREISPDLPILYTSGYSRDLGPFQDMLAHGEHFLTKPFGPVDLARKVREILDMPRNKG